MCAKNEKKSIFLMIVITFWLTCLCGIFSSMTAKAATITPSFTGDLPIGVLQAVKFDVDLDEFSETDDKATKALYLSAKYSGGVKIYNSINLTITGFPSSQTVYLCADATSRDPYICFVVSKEMGGSEEAYITLNWEKKKVQAPSDMYICSLRNTVFTHTGETREVTVTRNKFYPSYPKYNILYGTSRDNINSTVQPVDVGTYYYRVATEANEYYLENPEQEVGSFTIQNPAGSFGTVTAPASKTYDGQAIGEASASGATGTVSFQYVGDSGTSYNSSTPPTMVGNYKVYAAVSPSANYRGIDITDTGERFSITKYSMNLTNDLFVSIPASGKYDRSSRVAFAAVKGAADAFVENVPQISYKETSSGVVQTTAPKNKGNYEVYVSVEGTADYDGIANTKVGSFTITKYVPGKEQLSVQVPTEFTYCKASPSISIQKIPLISTDSSTGIGEYTLYYKNGLDFQTTVPQNVGRYQIYYTAKESEFYEETTGYVDTGVELVIEKAEQLPMEMICAGRLSEDYKLVLEHFNEKISDDLLPEGWSFGNDINKEPVENAYTDYTIVYLGEDAECYENTELKISVFRPQKPNLPEIENKTGGDGEMDDPKPQESVGEKEDGGQDVTGNENNKEPGVPEINGDSGSDKESDTTPGAEGDSEVAPGGESNPGVVSGDENDPGNAPGDSNGTPEIKADTIYPVDENYAFLIKQVSYVYNGKQKKPTIVVYEKGKKLNKSMFKVFYQNNVKPGIAKVTVKIAKTNAPSFSIPFSIKPAKVSLRSAGKKGKNSIHMVWKRSKVVSGYQIQYATKKSFKNAKKLTIKKASANKKDINKLKKTNYYVRIRGYKTIKNGKNLYGPWSKTMLVRIK